MTLSHRPEEAMLFAMMKACLHSNIFLFLESWRNIFLSYMDTNIMRNLHLHKTFFYKIKKQLYKCVIETTTSHQLNISLRQYYGRRRIMRFTVQDTWPDGWMPFLDTIIKPEHNKTLLIEVYRKPTQTNLYLEWHNHHHIAATYSEINILIHRT